MKLVTMEVVGGLKYLSTPQALLWFVQSSELAAPKNNIISHLHQLSYYVNIICKEGSRCKASINDHRNEPPVVR